MYEWAGSSWQKHQCEVAWARLQVSEQEEGVVPLLEGVDHEPPLDSAYLHELRSRLQALRQQCDTLAQEREAWQLERRRLTSELAVERQRLDSERTEFAKRQESLEVERAELRAERQRVEHALGQLKQEMVELRQSVSLRDGIPTSPVETPSPPSCRQQDAPGQTQDALGQTQDALGQNRPAETDANFPASIDAPCRRPPASIPSAERAADTSRGFTEEEEEGHDLTERLVRFTSAHHPRPIWFSSSVLLFGAAVAASCAAVVWVSFDSIMGWLRF